MLRDMVSMEILIYKNAIVDDAESHGRAWPERFGWTETAAPR